MPTKATRASGSAWGILNHRAEPWTHQAWINESDAWKYLALWQRTTGIKLPRHRVVPVRVTVRLTKETTAFLRQQQKASP